MPEQTWPYLTNVIFAELIIFFEIFKLTLEEFLYSAE